MLKFISQYTNNQIETRFNLHKANYGALNNHLLRVNWVQLYSLQNVDHIVDKFYGIVYEGVEMFVLKPFASRFRLIYQYFESIYKDN